MSFGDVNLFDSFNKVEPGFDEYRNEFGQEAEAAFVEWLDKNQYKYVDYTNTMLTYDYKIKNKTNEEFFTVDVKRTLNENEGTVKVKVANARGSYRNMNAGIYCYRNESDFYVFSGYNHPENLIAIPVHTIKEAIEKGLYIKSERQDGTKWCIIDLASFRMIQKLQIVGR